MISLGSATLQRQHVSFRDQRVDCNAGTGPATCTPFLGTNLQESSVIERDSFVGSNNASATAAAFEMQDPNGGGHFVVRDSIVSKSGNNDCFYDHSEGANASMWQRLTCNNTGFVTGVDGWHIDSIDANPTFGFLFGFHAENVTNGVEFAAHTGGTADNIDTTGTNTTLLLIDSGALEVKSHYLYCSACTNLVVDNSVSPAITILRTQFPNGLAYYTNGANFVNGIENNSYMDVLEIPNPGVPASGFERLYSDSTSHTATCITHSGGNCASSGGTTITVASGTAALGTSAISSATCATVVTVTATGTLTTDDIMSDFNADPTSTVGYIPSASGMLTIIKYPTANNVNFKVCNNTSASITPGAVTLNWRVVR